MKNIHNSFGLLFAIIDEYCITQNYGEATLQRCEHVGDL